ncbi:MAG: GNAT family N-acetyltransferase [candidate division Zixibacteria bacterium]|nr:GNAT family N-acetyltransferase [candidate division Zixibacteria bacterium]
MAASGSFVIRPAVEADTSLLSRFIHELAEYEKLSHEAIVPEKLLRESLFGKLPSAYAIIGEHDSKPVSFAIYFFNFSTFLSRRGLYLEDLYVKPEMRGHGFGKQLLVHLAKIARDNECGRFEWAVLDWNEPAIGFYKKLGAKPQDEWTVFRLERDGIERLAVSEK